MKKTVRMLGLLMALLMVASVLAVAVSADFVPDDANTALWQIEDGRLIGDNTAGDGESSLKLFALPEGLTDYTVEADMSLLVASGTLYGCVLSNWKSSSEYTGVWIRASKKVNFEQRTTSGYKAISNTAIAEVAQVGPDVVHKIKLHFHNGTADFYLDGAETPTAAGALEFEYGGFVAVMIKAGTKVAYDNFKVTDNSTSSVLWQDDFSTTTGKWGKIPVVELNSTDFGWPVCPAYSKTNYKMAVSDKFGETGNKSLYVLQETGDWCGMTIVPAETLAGVRKYVFSVKFKFVAATKLTFRFNSEDETKADGDWGGVSWTTHLENYGFNGSEQHDASVPSDNVQFDPDMNVMVIAFDLDAGTEELWLNGTLMSTRDKNVKSQASAISMMIRGIDGYIDDLKLETGTYAERGTVLWSEDFESYELSASEASAPERPYQDYTGRKPGEVIFEDDYNDVQDLDDFYFVAKLNGEFKKAIYAISDEIDGSTCARITGSWATVEIVPEEVFTPYQVYTIHMKMKIESDANRFTLFYNTATPATNKTSCGFFEFRYSDLKIECLGIINGVITKTEATTGLELGEVFDFALEVNCDSGTCFAYINGEFVCFGSNLGKTQSALYILAENAVGYIDDVKVTAGTYADFTSASGTQTDDSGEATSDSDNSSTEAPTVETPSGENTAAPGDDTVAPGDDSTAPATEPAGPKAGCASSAGIGSIVLLTGILSLGGVMLGKKKENG